MSEQPAARESLGARWGAIPRAWQWWWGGGLLLLAAAVLLRWLRVGGCLQVFLVLALVSWAIPTSLFVAFWTWRKLTYRVGVRLLISYLLIGILPFPLMAVLGAFGAYLLLGQYTSSVVDELTDRLRLQLSDLVAEAADADPDAVPALLASGPRFPAELESLDDRVGWLHSDGDATRRSAGGLELPVPGWAAEGLDGGHFLTPSGPVLAAVSRRGERVVAAWIPLDAGSSRVLSRDRWFEARFVRESVTLDERQGGFAIRTGGAEDLEGEGEAEAIDGEEVLLTAMQGQGPWRKRWVFFARLSPEVRAWTSGERLADRSLVTLLVTSPQEALADLFSSPYRIGAAVWGVVLGLGLMFLVFYLLVAAFAGLLIFDIARSTSRLTRGAREVEAGRLDYRIPARRRDQLGDLASSFNAMSGSVQEMLAEVAEKERLKSELGLAREIQQSLLPARRLRHGPIEVHAHFRPAAEVGGDYYDLFPLEDGRLLVAIGDVAGHGLPTGLLMAMVKSAVATLVREGHRGAEILERLNRFMLEQPRAHRMVTLALAEIDPAAGTVVITNAAHPPMLLTGDEVEEILLPALPVGFPWPDRPPSRLLPLRPGTRLVFYSDGLVEAVDAEDRPYGYERLQAFFAEHLELGSDRLIPRLLEDLERHVGGRELDDDLTVLVVDCGVVPQ